MSLPKAKRPICIGNASGAIGDGIDQVYRLAVSGQVDAITADYLAEFNIAWKAIELQTRPDLGFESNFLEQIAWDNGAAAREVSNRGIKIVHNGGALNPRGLAEKTNQYFQSLGIHDIKVAWVEGDNVTEHLKADSLGNIRYLDDLEGTFSSQGHQMLAANVYTGQRGILKALETGADIVICGRCCDASPVMALASWWHGWGPADHKALAGSLMAGHLIECGAYVTGGNYCGAQEISIMHHVGYPIAEIERDGTSIITKPEGSNGAVTVDTCTAQLLYEIQGAHYLNPDVTARIDQVRLDQVGRDRVRLSGIVGLPAPETSKLSICLFGGFQAELCGYAAGPEVEFKFQSLKDQVMRQIDMSDFTTFSIQKYGSVPRDPKSQAECTITYRMFAQSPKKEAFTHFRRAIFYNGMQGYCGLHLNMDWRTMEPRPYVKYVPGLVRQTSLPDLSVRFVAGETYKADPLTIETLRKNGIPLEVAESHPQPPVSTGQVKGKMVRRPLGDLFFGRSGDKGGNANIDLWVRSSKAYPFARSFLSVSRLVELLGDDWDGSRHRVERCEFPHLRAVHFVIRGFLQEGVSSSSILDGFGKSISEFLRARLVEMPAEFLEEEDEKRSQARKKGCVSMMRL